MSRQESDTIYRQAAIDALYHVDEYNGRSVQAIRDLPSAQPEIIRCKDCKWFGDFGCAIRVVDDTDKPTENDFCSFAERRQDEQTD